MKVHFIAIGGAVMHNLAIALHKKGYQVSGSDDEIFEPSRSRLQKYGLLAKEEGWHIERISNDIDTVILGMHAREDNPELKKAVELGLNIMSFPEYLYEQTKDKQRVVIGGSHGKTTITSMIMHVLKSCNISFDYMVGSMIDGFETMVGLQKESQIAIFEGDEYLTSTLDPRPKFHLYKPDIAVINGIAWDHINVFPEYETYLDQFRIFVEKISSNGKLIYYEGDSEVAEIANGARDDIRKTAYGVHGYFQNSKGFFAADHKRVQALKIFGEHNMQNMSAAKAVCEAVGIEDNDFYKAMGSFSGSSKRLQLISENVNTAVYLDFAHAPSKVKATVEAVAERYPERSLIACLELHTFSSLNKEFLKQYKDNLIAADHAYVYFNPHALKLKKLKMISKEEIASSFGGDNLTVFDDSKELFDVIKDQSGNNRVYLFMSSGDFNGSDLQLFAKDLI